MFNASKVSPALIALSVALAAPVAQATESLKLTVGGTVDQNCSIVALDTGTHMVALDAQGSKTIDFDVDCNVPIKVTLKAERGAFALDADRTPEHTADYTSFVDYTAGFTLPIKDRTWTVAGQPGASLTGGVDFVPDDGVMSNTPPFDAVLKLAMNWNKPSADLLAGRYGETLTITVVGQ